ncbi:ribonuclease R [Paracoccaceae bacterium GXU_MW_L88]
MSKLPSKDALLDFIQSQPSRVGKREIARAFGIKGDQRAALKDMLRELADEGLISRGRKNAKPGALPPVTVLRVTGLNDAGEPVAVPQQWKEDGAPPPILVLPSEKAAPGAGDRILAKLRKSPDGPGYEAEIMRLLKDGPARLLGIFRKNAEGGGRIVPVDKGADRDFLVPAGETNGARDGELVEGEQFGSKARAGLPKARITARLGDPSAPKSVSLIAIHEHGIPDAFPRAALEEAEAAERAPMDGRTDLRDVPLITIDPSDARDHDDAVAAEETETGFTLWVAIADVAYYVRPGSALDKEARRRGNSTYFPDRVVPMLPEELSADLCSLHEGVDRPCVAVKITIDRDGNKTGHEFLRGMMNSPASLSYEQAQAAADGEPDAGAKPHLDVITNLFKAYAALKKARTRRDPVDLHLPERQIQLDDEGKVTSVAVKERFDAHRLIEEFMVLANVCAAETLEKKRAEFLYRVHEEPGPEKLDALREVVDSIGMTLGKGQVLQTQQLNRLIREAEGTEHDEMVNMAVLRAMTQAYYSPQNFSHFGLALKRYAHFTSPIRRYADLIVHRALISAHGWGKDGLPPEAGDELPATAEHISMTERRSMMAERDTTDRYLAAYLEERQGTEMEGTVSGIAKFGIFVKLKETGADGLIPLSSLGHEYYRYDATTQSLKGERTGRRIAAGMSATVRIAEVTPISGGMIFELLALEDKKLPTPPKRKSSTSPRRKQKRAKIKRSKTRKGR